MSHPIDCATAKGNRIEFYFMGGKKSLLNNGHKKAINILRNKPNSWVFLVPDLYPQNISFAHSTYKELKKELEKRFESELKRKNCDDRLKDRFLVHCFKYDLEVLLLVVDTGVLMSAFAFRGIPERTVRKAFTEAEVWVSPQLLREYRDTPIEPETDGTITHTQLRALLSGIASFVVNAKLVVKKSLSLCRDEGDNMVLECCLAAGADYLINGDKDLLEIDETTLRTEISKLRIVSPRIFLEHRK